MAKNRMSYTIDINADIGQASSKLNEIKRLLDSTLNGNKNPSIERTLESISTRLNSVLNKASKPITSMQAFDSMQSELRGVDKDCNDLIYTLQRLQNASKAKQIELLPPDERDRIKAVNSALNDFNEAQKAAKQETKELTDAKRDLKRVEDAIQKTQKKQVQTQTSLDSKRQERDALQERLENLNKQNDAISKAQEKYNQLQKLYEDSGFAKNKKQIDPTTGQEVSLPGARAELRAAQKNAPDPAEYDRLTKAVTEADNKIRQLENTLSNQKDKLDSLGQEFDEATVSVNTLNKAFQKTSADAVKVSFQELIDKAKELGVNLDGISTEGTQADIQELTTRLQSFENDALAKLTEGTQTAVSGVHELKDANDELRDSLEKTGETAEKENQAFADQDALASRIKQFVGLAGSITALRSVMSNAIATIKELDEQMTEMAVVTDLGVSDYWEQLPEYTKRANDLGVSIKSAYEAATLYYQQGLKTNEVMAVSNATLKMARIAGLSAEDATNKMTAALRGFNMEVNETNADRIADVYSKLAAITASNTEEISSAMTKTASIAYSAGMQFETTAAFLSQIIETTRESAETAGTALKTVIARFQELKKNPAEIVEVDGEQIDANKIDTALKNVGVSLRDTTGQFRNLDDVFLELASKWDGLDKNTQRYIATIAAGSRQQSRFIAMMQDYARTTELVDAANNAAGASAEQFDKTMESLSAKLNQLTNAWNTFSLGVMNSGIIKWFVDGLTAVISAVNSLTDAFGSFFGGFAKLGIVVGSLKLADKALVIFTKNVKELGVFGSLGKVFSSASDSVKNWSKTLIPAIKRTKEYKDAILLTRQAQEAANLAEQKHNANLQKNIDSQNKSKAIDDQRAASKAAMWVAFQLTNEQIEEANELTGLGIANDKAAILVKKGITKANFEELASLKALNDEEKKGLVTKYASIAAGSGEATTKMGGVIASKLMTAAAKLETKGKLGSAAASKLAAAANSAFAASAAGLALAIAGVVVVIAALTLAIIGVVKAIKDGENNKFENRLEKAKEAANEATSAFNDARDAYDNLINDVNTYNEVKSGLTGLIEGTEAWKNKLQEVNDSAQDLINKYPELLAMEGAISYTAGGMISIDQSALDKVVAQREKIKQQTSVQSSLTQLDLQDLAYEEAIGRWKAKVPSITNEQLRDIQARVVSGKIQDTDFASLGFATQTGFENYLSKHNNQIGEDIANIINTSANLRKSMVRNALTGMYSARTIDSFAQLFSGSIDLQQVASANMQNYRGMSIENLQAEYKRVFGTDYVAPEGVTEKNGMRDDLAQRLKYADIEAPITDTLTNALAAIRQSPELKSVFDFDLNLNPVTARAALQKIRSEMEDAVAEGFENGIDLLREKRVTLRAGIREIFGETALQDIFDSNYNLINQLYSKIETMALSNDSVAFIFGSLSDFLNPKNITEFTNEIDKINFSSAIDAAASLNELLDSDNLALQQFSILYQNLEEASVGLSAQVNEAMNSLSADAMKELIEDGKILAEEIRGLATEGSKLKKMLDNTGISTNTVAVYFEKFAKNELSAISQTNNFVKVLNKLLAAENSISDMFEMIDTFDAGRSITEVREFLDDIHESVNNLLEIGAYGDGALTNYAKLLLGDKGYKQVLAEFNGDLKQVAEYTQNLLESTGSNFYGLWKQFDLVSEAVSLGAGNEIKFNFESIESVEGLVQELVNKLGISKELATSMVGDAQAYSNSLTTALNRLSAEDSIKEWLKNPIQLGDLIYYDENEFNVIASQIGADAATLKKTLQKSFDDFRLFNKENIQDALFESITDTFKQTNGINLGEIFGQLLDLGYDESEAKSMINDLLNNLQSKFINIDFAFNPTSMRLLNQEVVDKIEDFEILTAGSITEGIIDGLQDPRVKAEEKIAALEQAQIMAQAVAVGMATGLEGVSVETLSSRTTVVEEYYKGLIKKQRELKNSSNYTSNAIIDNFDDIAQEIHDEFGVDQNNEVLAYMTEAAQLIEEGADKLEMWENPYNWLYHMNQVINEQLRERERIERRYQRLLDNNQVTHEIAVNTLKDELALLKQQALLQSNRAANARTQAASLISNAPGGFADYVAMKNGTIYIDYDKLPNWTADQGAVFEEFIGKLEEMRDVINESEDALMDIQDDVDEIAKTGLEQYNTLLSDVRDALISQGERQINELENVNDSINDANSKLLDRIQEQIDETRRTRENSEKLKNLQDKQTRLAYLQQDTSGANVLDILKLQDEITSDEQDYQDTLIDQAISEMQKANERASEQRQEQIDIARAQLDYWSTYDSWQAAEGILNPDLTSDLPFSDTLSGKLLGEYANDGGLRAMTLDQRQQFADELNQNAALAQLYEDGSITQDVASLNSQITSYLSAIEQDNSSGMGNAGIIDKLSVKGPIYQLLLPLADELSRLNGYIREHWNDANDDGQQNNNSVYDIDARDDIREGLNKVRPLMDEEWYNQLLANTFWGTDEQIAQVIKYIEEYLTKLPIQGGGKPLLMTKYATGGLADFTGPAWMDGTSSSPELVLNARDTQNFIALKDILSEIMRGQSFQSSANTSVGNNYYDVQISVDKLENDYDVENLASKIRQMITDDAMYRNVNAISLLR